MQYGNLTKKIIRSFYDVYDELGAGFLESVYRNSLQISLENYGINYQQEEKINVYYKNQIVGEFRADLIIENKVLIEIKACKEFNQTHTSQIINYLKATNIEIGLLVNFGPTLKFKRFIYDTQSPCLSV